jgi:hypothetical protein
MLTIARRVPAGQLVERVDVLKLCPALRALTRTTRK